MEARIFFEKVEKINLEKLEMDSILLGESDAKFNGELLDFNYSGKDGEADFIGSMLKFPDFQSWDFDIFILKDEDAFEAFIRVMGSNGKGSKQVFGAYVKPEFAAELYEKMANNKEILAHRNISTIIFNVQENENEEFCNAFNLTLIANSCEISAAQQSNNAEILARVESCLKAKVLSTGEQKFLSKVNEICLTTFKQKLVKQVAKEPQVHVSIFSLETLAKLRAHYA